MLLTFSANEEKLLNKSKIRSTRANEYYYLTRWNNGIRQLDIWYGNPRHMHLKNKKIYKMGIANWDEFSLFNISQDLLDRSGYAQVSLKSFLLDMAIEDGFISVEEYIKKLGLINKMTEQEVKDKTWASLKWHWLEGPYTYSQYNLLKTKEGVNWTN